SRLCIGPLFWRSGSDALPCPPWRCSESWGNRAGVAGRWIRAQLERRFGGPQFVRTKPESCVPSSRLPLTTRKAINDVFERHWHILQVVRVGQLVFPLASASLNFGPFPCR